jgi:phage terminase large subunit
MKQIVNRKYIDMFPIRKGIRYVILIGGRGAGRSTVASQYILSHLFAPDYMRCAIMRSVYADIRHSSWKELNDRIDEQEVRKHLSMTENDMEIKYGLNSIKAHAFRQSSSGHSAKLKSLASYNVVWIEEAEEVGEQEFMTLDDTLRTVKGDIIVIFSLNPPAKSHWIIQRWFDCIQAYDRDDEIIRDFYQLKLKPEATDVLYINTNYKDNIANLDKNTITRYEAYKTTKPDYYHQMIEGFVPETVRGKIFNGWRLINEIPHEARLVRRGLDFGWFPDPMALIDIYYYNGGYILDEKLYGTEIKNKTVAEVILNDSLHKDTIVVADSAEPKSIDEIYDYGVNIIGTPKGKDSVNYGINVMTGLRISVTKRSINVWKSYENYAWDEDKDGNPKGVPKHTFSHAIDAVRYALVDVIASKLTPEQEVENKIEVLVNRDNYKKSQSRRFGV